MSEDTAAVTTVVPEFRLIARDPQELESARNHLGAFFAATIAALRDEEVALEENLEIATKFPIRTQPIKARLQHVARSIRYYEKALAAVRAGFHIIPNFGGDVFAIRTAMKKYCGPPVQGDPRWRPSVPMVTAPIAPAGSGRYVSTFPRDIVEREFKNDRGEDRVLRYGETFDEEIDFPFALARAEVLTATQQVMALRIFDELAVLPQARPTGDPMVVGIIRHSNSRREQRLMTFLVVWFLDTKTL